MSIYDEYGINMYREIEDKRVVLLQSGGLDSCVLASLFSQLGYDIQHVFVDYGFNSAERDLSNARRIVQKYGGKLHEVKLEMPWLKYATSLVDGKVNDAEASGIFNCVQYGTYVPMRNAVLLTIGSSLCDSLDIKYLACAFDGAENFITHEPECGTTDKHPTFVRKLESAINEGSSMYHLGGIKIRILTPLMGYRKEDTITMGVLLGTDFSLSNSCYNSDNTPCGICSACKEREKAFKYIGIKDPLISSI